MKTAKQLIDGLLALNVGKSAMAKAVGVDPALITRLYNGQSVDTTYTIGQKLEALLAKETKKSKA